MNEADLNKEALQLYINKYYNILPYFKFGEKNCIARVINSLIEAFNKRKRLPCFLVILLDKDVIEDVDPFCTDWNVLHKLINWLAKQLDIFVKRCCLEITERRPWAILTMDPKVIFIKMICRVDYYPQKSRLEKVCIHRAKFNDILNDVAAKRTQLVMNVMGCNSHDHFENTGGLSPKGKIDFWFEVDELLEKFDRNQIKLLPSKGKGKKNFHNN